MKNYNNSRKILSFLSFSVSAFLLTMIACSFAMMISEKDYNLVSAQYMKLEGDCHNNGRLLKLTDEAGLNQNGTVVMFSSNTVSNLAYSINIYNNVPDSFTGELVDLNNVMVSIDNGTPFNLGGVSDTTKDGKVMKEVYSRVIDKNTTVLHTIKVWIEEDTLESEANKSSYLTVKVIKENTEEVPNEGIMVTGILEDDLETKEENTNEDNLEDNTESIE